MQTSGWMAVRNVDPLSSDSIRSNTTRALRRGDHSTSVGYLRRRNMLHRPLLLFTKCFELSRTGNQW